MRLSLLGLSLVLLFPAAAAAQALRAPRTLTVTGSGEARAQADEARLLLGVETRAESAASALEANSSDVRRLLAALREAGVADDDLETAQVALDPVYTSPRPEGEPRLSGYRVENQVRVRVRDVERVGALLDAGVSAGANQVRELSFTVADESLLLGAARREAMARARTAAEQLADLAGARLGPVLRIEEAGMQRPGPMNRAVTLEAAQESVPIEAGQHVARFDVEVTWALQRPR